MSRYKDCYHCDKAIDTEKEKYVMLGTYNGTGKAKKNEDYFHFQCWLDHFNQAITKQIQAGVSKASSMLAGTMKSLGIDPSNIKITQ